MTTNNAVNTNLSGQTGTGTFVGSTSPTFVTPLLGTPTSGVLTNCTGTGGLRSFQIFQSGTAATYTKPANVTSILIELVGGGGGGGGSTTTATGAISSGAGGGAGGYARLYVASAASTYTYTVGAAGTAGTAGAGNGGTGGTTTFSASSLQATGGNGGTGAGSQVITAGSSVAGGFGGVGSNGNINAVGGSGQWGLDAFTAQYPGIGGPSFFAGGGPCVLGGAGIAAGLGAGGGGGSTNQNSAGNAGGAGGAGLIIVWEFS